MKLFSSSSAVPARACRWRPGDVASTRFQRTADAARVAFVAWNRANAAKIARVAIVTDNRLWHMVVMAMSLTSGQKMRAFDDLPSAETSARTR